MRDAADRALDFVLRRAIWVRDVQGRRRWLDVSPPTRLETAGRMLVLIVFVSAAIYCSLHAKWSEVAVAFGMLLFFDFGGTIDRCRDFAKQRLQSCLTADQCPWCTEPLSSADDAELRHCSSCSSDWWDVPGITPSVSPKGHREHVFALSLGTTLLALAFGLFGVIPIASMKSSAAECLIWGGATLVIWGISAWFAGRNDAAVLSCAAAGISPLALAIWNLPVKGHAAVSVTLLIASVAFASTGYIGAVAGRRSTRRPSSSGIGRLCAHCGYNLRALKPAAPCPECGSTARLR